MCVSLSWFVLLQNCAYTHCLWPKSKCAFITTCIPVQFILVFFTDQGTNHIISMTNLILLFQSDSQKAAGPTKWVQTPEMCQIDWSKQDSSFSLCHFAGADLTHPRSVIPRVALGVVWWGTPSLSSVSYWQLFRGGYLWCSGTSHGMSSSMRK